MLEHGAGALRDVAQHLLQPVPTVQTSRASEAGEEAVRGGTTSAARVREYRDRGEVARGVVGDGEDRIVVPHPGRAEVPLDDLLEAADATDVDTVASADLAAVVDHDLDLGVRLDALTSGPLVGAASGRIGERGRPAGEHGRPGPLAPGEGAGVVDVDPVMDRPPLPAPEPPSHIVRAEPGGQRLLPADDAILVRQDLLDRVHPAALPGARKCHTGDPAPVENEPFGTSWSRSSRCRGSTVASC